MGMLFSSRREEELMQENQNLTKSVKRLEAEIEELRHQLEIQKSLSEPDNELTLKLKITEGQLSESEKKYDQLKKTYYAVVEQLKQYEQQNPGQSSPAPAPDTRNRNDNTELKTISQKLAKIEEALADTAHKDNIIKELHTEVQKYNRDIFSQIAKPHLNAIIRIHTNFSGMVAKAKEEYMQSNSPLPENIYKRMKPTLLMIQDILEDEFDVRAFSPEVGDRYDPKLHQGIQSLSTRDPELGGTIVACKECGFVRSDNGKVIKQALVVVYRLEK